jgi:hypothetical protein
MDCDDWAGGSGAEGLAVGKGSEGIDWLIRVDGLAIGVADPDEGLPRRNIFLRRGFIVRVNGEFDVNSSRRWSRV